MIAKKKLLSLSILGTSPSRFTLRDSSFKTKEHTHTQLRGATVQKHKAHPHTASSKKAEEEKATSKKAEEEQAASIF